MQRHVSNSFRKVFDPINYIYKTQVIFFLIDMEPTKKWHRNTLLEQVKLCQLVYDSIRRVKTFVGKNSLKLKVEF
jgi:hypothetical protein